MRSSSLMIPDLGWQALVWILQENAVENEVGKRLT